MKASGAAIAIRGLNFLKISEASLNEVWYCLHVAQRLNYLTSERFKELEAKIKQVSAPLTGLVRATRELPDHVILGE